MKFTYSWLKTHLDTTATPELIAEKLTAIGLEVDQFTDLGKKYAPFIIAEITAAIKHPNADKLRVCTVNTGEQELQIVCGAPNARPGIKVVLAPVGALIPNGNFQIKKSKIRDVESNGMLCSADELELGGDSTGIIEVPGNAPLGGNYAEYAGLNDSFFEINVTPNRADCLSVYGVARDLAGAGLGKLIKLQFKQPKVEIKSPISVNSATYYIGRFFTNVKNLESPTWLKQRLTSIGLTPISALVDITNFINFDLGQPLHVFDANKLRGNINVRSANKSEKLNALNNKTYELQGTETVIADDSTALALAGVIGGVESSVSETTTNIFLEAAWFHPDQTAATGRHHQIITDSRFRFERGVDAEATKSAAEIASSLIIEICGGQASELIVSGTKPTTKRHIEFDFGKTKTLGGIDIETAQSYKILESLGCEISGNTVTPPSWRNDITGAADLVEEIIRIYGYDKIPVVNLPYKTRVEATPVLKNNQLIRQRLTANGLNEVVTYSFINPKTAEIFSFENQLLNLQNPISIELSTMRPSIVPALLETALNNHNRGFKDLKLFEIGPIFTEDSEQIIVSGIRTGKNHERNIYGDYRNIDAFDAKADLQSILKFLGAPNGKIQKTAPNYYHPGRSGGLYLGKTPLGFFGEIHPQILKSLGISTPVSVFEVFLQNLPTTKKKYQPLQFSDFQGVTRDFAFVVAKDLSSGDLINGLVKADKLISNIYIFDIYQGDKLEAGKKSVAISVEIQPLEKTLNDADIESIVTKINEIANKEFNATLRA